MTYDTSCDSVEASENDVLEDDAEQLNMSVDRSISDILGSSTSGSVPYCQPPPR